MLLIHTLFGTIFIREPPNPVSTKHFHNADQTFSTLVQYCANGLQMFCVYYELLEPIT